MKNWRQTEIKEERLNKQNEDGGTANELGFKVLFETTPFSGVQWSKSTPTLRHTMAVLQMKKKKKKNTECI